MASIRKRATSDCTVAAASAAGANQMMLHQIQEEPSSQSYDICNLWRANPAFEPKRVLLRRMFFINENKTKFVYVGF